MKCYVILRLTIKFDLFIFELKSNLFDVSVIMSFNQRYIAIVK